MINYIIEASICLACFYSIYWLFLRKEKLLSLNRFYLLSTAIISLIIPLLSFEIGLNLFETAQATSQNSFTSQVSANPDMNPTSSVISVGLIYGIGLSIALLLLIFKVVYAKRKIGKSLSFEANTIKVAETEGKVAFSFLNTIFIGKDLSKNAELKTHIIAHESAHIQGKHSIDLFFFELLKCLFWFNPFSYLYCKSIKLQHEFIADQYALEMTNPESYQRSLLELTLSQVNSSLVSNFNEHPIETRLKMIQKLNSNVMNKLKTLFAVPVLALLFIAFACTETVEPEAELLDIIEVPVAPGEITPLDNDLLRVIDSMRVVERKFSVILDDFKSESEFEGSFDGQEILELSYKSSFEGTYNGEEIREIPDTEIRKAAFILKNLEEAKANGVVFDIITEQDPGLQRDRSVANKKAYNSFVLESPKRKTSTKAKALYEVISETKDKQKN